MKKINIIKNLGFNPNMISEKDLRREFVSVIEILLSDFYMDDSIKSRELYVNFNDKEKMVDGSKTCKYCRGFNDKNISYDFICIYDNVNKTYELIIEPTHKTKFADVNFSESISIKYSLNNNLLEVNRLTNDTAENLIEEQYLYTRSSRNKALILFSEVKTYDRFLVSILDEKSYIEYKKFYLKGKYGLGSFVKPEEIKIFATTKMGSEFHILKVNGNDVGMVICNGTMVYDYNKEKLGDFKILSKENDDRNPLFVNHIKNYQDYLSKQYLHNKIKRFY